VFVDNSGQVIKIPRYCQAMAKIMRDGQAHPSNSRFLHVDEVGTLKGFDSQVFQAVSKVSLKPLSLSHMPNAQGLDRGVVDPVEALIGTETKEQLHQALGTLTKEEQIIAELRFGLSGAEEKTFREIGEAIGCSEPTAFRKVNALLLKLRIILPH
jgi:DNA-directed RNA polymerase sigma subunit (sigma70/sigma32)